MPMVPPNPVTGVPRSDVPNVVQAMLLDPRVKWITVFFEATQGEDRFTITPSVTDPRRRR